MKRIDMSRFIRDTKKTVESHYLGNGAYCRWLWQNEQGTRRLGINEYGCADAANILYSINEFVFSEDERAQRIAALRGMQDPETGLYYHGFDCTRSIFWADKTTGLSKNFWLRSIGWFAVALVDIIEILGSECDGEIVRIFADLMQSILQFRDADSGMYYQVVNFPKREGNYLETSGSSMIAYAMMKGARLGVIDESFATYGKETFDGICQRYLGFDAKGNLSLGGICLVAGLGSEHNLRRDGSYEYYISEPVVENDAKGVAPFILSYTELLSKRKA